MRLHQGQQHKAGDLRAQTDEQHAGDAVTRCQPAPDEVGGNAGGLVEQKKQGQGQRRIPELVKVQQHQHAQGAVGESKAPVGGCHHQVIGTRRAHQSPTRPMWQARSIMRQA